MPKFPDNYKHFLKIKKLMDRLEEKFWVLNITKSLTSKEMGLKGTAIMVFEVVNI